MSIPAHPTICFVTNELYPAGPGGIGRLLYNFARQNFADGKPADIHFLIDATLGRADTLDVLLNAFDGIATIHIAPVLSNLPSEFAQLLDQTVPWTPDSLFAKSYSLYLGLRAAERTNGKKFDYIEFPDFGGWAVATIEAKRAQLDFRHAKIVARLHSTQGIIYHFERFAHSPSAYLGALFDAERLLLKHADMIVGHVPAIVDFNRSFYNLFDSWAGKTIVEFPPILLDQDSGKLRSNSERKQSDAEIKDFIFSSRIQPFKRPDLFVRAAIAFYERHPEYEGFFRLVSYGWDQSYIAELQDLVPESLRERVVFILSATEAERATYLRNSIVVIPSDYESLCIFAYEALQMNCKIILSKACHAFSQGHFWVDRGNCLFFDGTVSSLTDVLEFSLGWVPQQSIPVLPDQPYWLSAPEFVEVGNALPPPSFGLTFVFHGFENTAEFERSFGSATYLKAQRSCADEDLVFAMPKGLFAEDGLEVQRLRQQGWGVLFTSGKRESPLEFATKVIGIAKEWVSFCSPGYDLTPAFLSSARAALASEPSISVYAGHVQLMNSSAASPDFVRIYCGEMPTIALTLSRAFPPSSIVKTELLKRTLFDELAGDKWFQVFARKCVLEGESIIVAPLIAASLDDVHSGKIESTKRIAGTILDQVGVASKMAPRLLALEQPTLSEVGGEQGYSIAGDRLKAARRVHPYGRVREWEPVAFHEPTKGLLVHPIVDEIVAAEIIIPDKGLSRIVVSARNVNRDNTGTDVRIFVAPRDVSSHDLVEKISLDPQSSGSPAETAWVHIGPGEAVSLALSVFKHEQVGNRIVVATKVPSRRDERNCHLVVEKIDVWYREYNV